MKESREFAVALGAKVKDKVTGYTGIVIGRTEWLYGCFRYTVQSQEMKDGKPVESMGFDEDALDVLDTPEKRSIKSPGGPGRTDCGKQAAPK
jgi:hypothetical protein